MSPTQDYYAILGIEKNASTSDIKKAYRKLAHKHHPDKGGTKEDEARFREVNEAYQVLSDPAKRQQYDQFGASGPGFNPGGQGTGAEGFAGFGGSGFGFDNFGDIFEQFFSGGAGATTRGPSRGADLELQLKLSFEEAVRATTKQVKVTRRVVCQTCRGNGAEPGTKIVNCDRCGGAGEIRTTRQTILGTMQQVTTCPECRGEGKRPEKACQTCGGEGRVQESGNVTIDIPAGIDNGQTIRVPGQGEAGERGAPPGHLYVTVEVEPSQAFERDGADLKLTVPVSFAQAALGDQIEIPTLDGRTAVDIPPGTPSGRVLRVKGAGVPKLQGSGRGDLLVTVEIEVPKKLTAEEKRLLEELKGASGGRPAAKKSWFEKLGL